MRRLIALAAALALAATIAGCSGNKSDTNTAPAASTATPSAPAQRTISGIYGDPKDAKRSFSFEFTSDGKFTGSGGSMKVSGTYVIAGDKLTMTPVEMNGKAPTGKDAETQTVIISTDGNTLTDLKNSANTLVKR